MSCEEAIDSIICDKDNGLVWAESASFEATLVLDAPETFNTIIIQNGAGRQDHKISGIQIQIKTKTLTTWSSLPQDSKVKGDASARVTDAGSVFHSSGQEFMQITFKPVKEVKEIWIRLMQATGKTATINEVLIPREFKLFFFYLYNFPGWHESAKTFTNIDCEPLNNILEINKDECKAECFKNPHCTAFNFARGLSACSLKKCPTPIVVPTDGNYPKYKGYYQTGSNIHSKASGRCFHEEI